MRRPLPTRARQRRPNVVVITGASAGVGRATANAFAREGARIGLLARGPDRLEAAARDVRALGGDAVIIPVDVADSGAVMHAAEIVERDLGPIDVWINNAMTSVFAPVVETRPEEYRRVLEVTFLGYVHGTLAALRFMRPRNRGHIIQVGSALAFRGIPLQSAYCAAKHAIQGFTESLRSELLHERSRVRVSEVHLSAMNTPQFDWVLSRLDNRAQPVPPIYQPEVAAEAIRWITRHPRRRTLLVGYPTFKAIWGNRLASGYADRYLAQRGYKSQQTREPENPTRPNNLWEPAPGDFGAHGRFDARASVLSPYTWITKHRAALGIGAGLLALAALGGAGVELARKGRGRC